MSETTFMGVPRDRVDWCPRIDNSTCNDCMECFNFCPHDVFTIDETATPKLQVKNPHNCVVFCRACSKTCGPDSISFPNKNETTAYIKDLRKKLAGAAK